MIEVKEQHGGVTVMPLPRNSDKIQVSVYLDKQLKERVAKLARKQRRSVSNLIEVLCEQAVEGAEQEEAKRAS
ncbi:ribbon-helix-helix protein, CopG family [Chroococcidiopsis sp. CCMEE 29]|uniref:ribbon-helix-helix domain-containing protein n=1 Tax=Chroococcidiopsis sp. CCMEE 29 TaxID=155894 RepID=UPI0020207532|nr:ribbon-helix-helix protein, CopG family [Chroococcidiopsis sp. CCMEE 29]